MHSCLYEGTVLHRRYASVERAFMYRLYMTLIDLSEFDTLINPGGPLSKRFAAPALFRRADYLGDPAEPLDVAVRKLVEVRTGFRPAGPIRLLTNLRSFGYGINPVSFYFCYDDAGEQVKWLVAEVTNTPWNERHCYVVPWSDCNHAREIDHAAEPTTPKALHVSPFLDMQMGYRWRISAPSERLTIGIENLTAGGKPFEATLSLRRTALTRAARRRMALRYPLLTWRIALAIYWQAVLIWWRGVPFVPHPEPALPSLSKKTITTPQDHSSREVSV